MATYKVIQDIEAEDKLIGPFSFRQFIYLLVAAFMGFLCFTVIARGAPFLLVLFAPPMAFCLFFAWPWTPDQPTEVWALARIRFMFKPRKRIWDQSGIKEFVTVTVPKKIEKIYTDGLSQTEVRSRLSALATTIDSRGWATKNSTGSAADDDRLINYGGGPMPVPDVDIRDADDILDTVNNPTAYQMGLMIDANNAAHRQELMDRLRSAGATVPQVEQPATPWFAQPAQAITQSQPIDTQVAAQPAIQPVQQPAPAPVAAQPAPTAPPQPKPAIINLSHDNDKSIATLAREAKRLDDIDGEVEIKLH